MGFMRCRNNMKSALHISWLICTLWPHIVTLALTPNPNSIYSAECWSVKSSQFDGRSVTPHHVPECVMCHTLSWQLQSHFCKELGRECLWHVHTVVGFIETNARAQPVAAYHPVSLQKNLVSHLVPICSKYSTLCTVLCNSLTHSTKHHSTVPGHIVDQCNLSIKLSHN